MQQMAQHGDVDLMEVRAVEKFLCIILKKYSQAMEMLLDFEDLSIEEVIGRLKAVEDHEEVPPIKLVAISDKLLYTEERWLA